jgi:hypothetical protein
MAKKAGSGIESISVQFPWLFLSKQGIILINNNNINLVRMLLGVGTVYAN